MNMICLVSLPFHQQKSDCRQTAASLQFRNEQFFSGRKPSIIARYRSPVATSKMQTCERANPRPLDPMEQGAEPLATPAGEREGVGFGVKGQRPCKSEFVTTLQSCYAPARIVFSVDVTM